MRGRIGVQILLSSLCFLASAQSAFAEDVPPTVLTFDDIDTGDAVISMPSGYGGVSWPDNVGVWSFPREFPTGTPYPSESPPNRVLFNRNKESGVAESVVAFIGGPVIF